MSQLQYEVEPCTEPNQPCTVVPYRIVMLYLFCVSGLLLKSVVQGTGITSPSKQGIWNHPERNITLTANAEFKNPVTVSTVSHSSESYVVDFSQDRYKLVYTILPAHLQATKDAVFAAGGGVYAEGKYIQVCFEIMGYGQFLPLAEAGANPHTGKPGKLERVEEVRVEILCIGNDVTKAAVAALKKYVNLASVA